MNVGSVAGSVDVIGVDSKLDVADSRRLVPRRPGVAHIAERPDVTVLVLPGLRHSSISHFTNPLVFRVFGRMRIPAGRDRVVAADLSVSALGDQLAAAGPSEHVPGALLGSGLGVVEAGGLVLVDPLVGPLPVTAAAVDDSVAWFGYDYIPLVAAPTYLVAALTPNHLVLVFALAATNSATFLERNGPSTTSSKSVTRHGDSI